jgi:long-chain acyl-CoA synthetase
LKQLETLFAAFAATPQAPMVEVLAGRAPARRLTRGQMLQAAAAIAALLKPRQAALGRPLKVGLVMHNSPEWVAADMALLASGAVEVPVPLAFAAAQALHLLNGADLCLVDAQGAVRLRDWQAGQARQAAAAVLVIDMQALLAQAPMALVFEPRPAQHVGKIIHTSGTTSRPKGVMIRLDGLDELLQSLRRRIAPGHFGRCLSVVPLSLLIEQVSAVYMTLLDGGTIVFPPAEQPLLGESGATPAALLAQMAGARPTALTLPPSMVEALLAECRRAPGEPLAARCQRLFGSSEPAFIACGGAPTAPAVLAELRRQGIPVFEGYGLSENSSVVAWNSPACFKPGTVGRPLDHVRVRLADDGELLVRSRSLFAGYAGTDPSSCEIDAEGWLHTGDMAEIDSEGFLRVFGRKKNLIITANGRNVSPEWLESRYKSLDCVEQAVIFGDGLTQLHGLFVIAPDMPLAQAQRQIEALGLALLSDVERVERVVCVQSGRELYARCFTVTGRPRRELIWRHLLSGLPSSESTRPPEHHHA